jgi:hypothetical protein
MLATLQNKPESGRVDRRSNGGEKKKAGSNGSASAARGKMVENVDVHDEPLVEAIDQAMDQYNQYGPPRDEVNGGVGGIAKDSLGGVVDPIGTGGKSLAIRRQGRNPADPDSPSPVVTDRQAFLLALGFRSISLLSQTFFQPDEFYQSLEPAHWLVFGTGFLAWEWKDLPAIPEEVVQAIIEQGGWRSRLVGYVDTQAGGRLRSWLWPGLFAVIYKGLQVTGLDETRLLVRLRFIPAL